MNDPKKQDFLDFINSKEVSPPERLSNNVLRSIKADLNCRWIL